jgi:hypothetical protein
MERESALELVSVYMNRADCAPCLSSRDTPLAMETGFIALYSLLTKRIVRRTCTLGLRWTIGREARTSVASNALQVLFPMSKERRDYRDQNSLHIFSRDDSHRS